MSPVNVDLRVSVSRLSLGRSLKQATNSGQLNLFCVSILIRFTVNNMKMIQNRSSPPPMHDGNEEI